MPLMDAGNVFVWQALKLYLPKNTKLTSVYRPPEDQLAFIIRTARKHGYRFKRDPVVDDPLSWEGALQFVRSKGCKVAAPGKSMHQKALAYDLSGPNLKKIKEAVLKAAQDGRIRLVKKGKNKNPLVERANHCVHVEIEGAVLDFEPFDYA